MKSIKLSFNELKKNKSPENRRMKPSLGSRNIENNQKASNLDDFAINFDNDSDKSSDSDGEVKPSKSADYSNLLESVAKYAPVNKHMAVVNRKAREVPLNTQINKESTIRWVWFININTIELLLLEDPHLKF